MSHKFQVGNRKTLFGRLGTVKAVGSYNHAVEFDNRTEGHDCRGSGEEWIDKPRTA